MFDDNSGSKTILIVYLGRTEVHTEYLNGEYWRYHTLVSIIPTSWQLLTILVFRFYPQNHSVARAAYKSPCIPYELTGAGNVGFWSGFEPTQIVSNNVRDFLYGY